MNKSIYKIILIVLGLLHIAVFCALPLAQMEGLGSALGSLAGAVGMGDALPEKLTLLAVLKMDLGSLGVDDATAGMVYGILISAMVWGIIIAIVNLIGNGKKSSIAALVMTIFQACIYVGYFALFSTLQDETYGIYQLSTGSFVVIGVLMLVQFIVSIVAIANAAPAAASVKPGKKDGTITGIRGAYQGAVIPVKSGETVTIGRDPSVSSIVVKDERASRKHCEVSYNVENNMYSVTDFSSNGTWSGGRGRLDYGTAVWLEAGSEISIGENGETFRLG